MNTYILIRMANDEWGNELMEKLAQEYFDTHPACQFVEVQEHAGWFLGFRRDMSIWSTANDCAHIKGDSFPTSLEKSINREYERRQNEQPIN